MSGVQSSGFDGKALQSVAKGEHLGLYCYQPYQQVTPSMTAVGMLWLSRLPVDSTYLADVALPMILIGAGQGNTLSPLTVSGNPGNHGNVLPNYGTTTFASGAVVDASASLYSDPSNLARFVCTGWVGTGSATASGSTNAFSFSIF